MSMTFITNFMPNTLPRLGFSVGDLAGIGPEVIYKTLLDERLLKLCTPVVYGTATALFDEFPVAPGAEPLAFRQLRDAADIAPGRLNAVTCWDEDFHLAPGQPSAGPPARACWPPAATSRSACSTGW